LEAYANHFSGGEREERVDVDEKLRREKARRARLMRGVRDG
jgi:hypothetical protein